MVNFKKEKNDSSVALIPEFISCDWITAAIILSINFSIPAHVLYDIQYVHCLCVLSCIICLHQVAQRHSVARINLL